MRSEMNKRGSGQFEMVISFIFFMGFILFLFIFLTPEDTHTLSGSVVTALHDSFEEQTGTYLSTLFLKANSTEPPENCFYINLTSNLFRYPVSDEGTYVVRLNGDAVVSDPDADILSIKNEDMFFRVAISPEFKPGILGGCSMIPDFELGSIVEREVISYDSFKNMTDRYYDDYNALREDLGVPPIYDFAIIPESLTELTMEPSSEIPNSVDVLARDYVFEVLKSDGTFGNQRINFRVW